MNSLYTIVAVLATVALIGSIGASLQQQAVASIVYQHDFKKLTSGMEKAVLDELAVNPPDPDNIQRLLDEYSAAVMELIRTPSPSP